MSLFRTEAVEHQRKRLYGEVTIHQPPAFAAFTLLIVVGTLAAAIWLVTGHYGRKETVTGWIAPHAGLAQVYAARGGVTSAVMVKVGDHVVAGAPLASFSLDVSGVQGGLAAQQRAQTQARIAEIDLQLAQSTLHQGEEKRREEDRAGALAQEAERVRDELKIAGQQLALAEQRLASVEPLVAKGFISGVDRDQRAQQVLNDRQTIVDLQRQAAAKMAEAEDARAEAKAMPAGGAVETSQLRATRAQLVQSLAELAVQEAVVVRSPINGVVAAANINVGDTAAPTSPLFAIAPTSGAMEAELLAPGKAIGFIKAGQSVRLRLDAFPSERFGTMDATITTVSRSPINPGQIIAPVEFKEPMYRLVARLSGHVPRAYGQTIDLRPGMTLKAYVTTSRRTFFEWMIDPLLAARRAAG